jgi:hypothetical protein
LKRSSRRNVQCVGNPLDVGFLSLRVNRRERAQCQRHNKLLHHALTLLFTVDSTIDLLSRCHPAIEENADAALAPE